MIKGMISAVIGNRHDRERKRIQPIVDAINEHDERLSRVSEEELRAQTQKFRDLIRQRTQELEATIAELRERKRSAADSEERERIDRELGGADGSRRRRGQAPRGDRRTPRRTPPRSLRHRARGLPAAPRHQGHGHGARDRVEHGAVRRAAHGRHRAAPAAHRRDGDGRRQDARRHAAALPERAAGQGRAPRHRELVPRPPRLAVDGAPLPVPGAHRRLPRRHRAGHAGAARRSTTPTSRTARTTSSASTTCATTWSCSSTSACSAPTSTPSSTRSTPCSSTKRGRR